MASARAAAGRSLMSAEANRRMFDDIAGRYDLLNRLTSLGLDRRWRRRAVATLAPRPGGRYLDVGCGTADMALEIVRRCEAATVVGVDPAEKMLDIGREKVRAATCDEAIDLQVGDAMDLAFDDSTFDGLVTGFCFRNIPRRDDALRQFRRVVAPGGAVVILELTKPTRRLLRAGHRFYTRRLVPLAGRCIARSREAYQYLADSVEDFPHPDTIAAMMEQAGLTKVTAASLMMHAATVFVGYVPPEHVNRDNE